MGQSSSKKPSEEPKQKQEAQEADTTFKISGIQYPRFLISCC